MQCGFANLDQHQRLKANCVSVPGGGGHSAGAHPRGRVRLRGNNDDGRAGTVLDDHREHLQHSSHSDAGFAAKGRRLRGFQLLGDWVPEKRQRGGAGKRNHGKRWRVLGADGGTGTAPPGE